ncbi:MAG: hypothetical protein WD135_09775 [Ferruginibacter sp.]
MNTYVPQSVYHSSIRDQIFVLKHQQHLLIKEAAYQLLSELGIQKIKERIC